MSKNWCIYLAVLLSFLVFHVAYQGWLAWVLLLGLLGLPLLSLLVSLPAMLTTSVSVHKCIPVNRGTQITLRAVAQCRLPLPPYSCRFEMTRELTGQKTDVTIGQALDTQHVGRIAITPKKSRVHDYLGLFRLPIRNRKEAHLTVRPLPLPMAVPEDLERLLSSSWRPKPGGFAENHELRLYRPGDRLNQVHWKLTAKTGKLMVREAMEPMPGRMALTVDISGTPEELDRKFGRLLWMGKYLLGRGLTFRIHARTSDGICVEKVDSERDLWKTIDRLLGMRAAEGTADQRTDAAWQCSIGGEPDEG